MRDIETHCDSNSWLVLCNSAFGWFLTRLKCKEYSLLIGYLKDYVAIVRDKFQLSLNLMKSFVGVRLNYRVKPLNILLLTGGWGGGKGKSPPWSKKGSTRKLLIRKIAI